MMSRSIAFAAVMTWVVIPAASGVVTNLPTAVAGGTGAAGDVQANDASSYTVAKSATGTINGFSTYGGAITSVYLLVEYAVDDGYDGTGALKINGTDASIIPADGDRTRHAFIDITGGSFGIDTSGEISSLAISFANNDSGAGDSIHFDYVYLLINPTLPIHMPPTWSDEFDGTGPADPSTWWYEEGYQRNNEWQYYTSTNGWQENGLFVIEGRQEPIQGYDYSSSSIRSQGNYSWQYGRAQIRAKLPCSNGMWPAIWMVGDTGEWPSNGECDIMEWYSEKTLSNCARGTTTRWTAAWDSSSRTMATLEPVDPGWRTNFHVWTIQWDAQNVRLYCDNILMNTTAQSWLVNPTTQWGPLEPFKQPHSLWLNLAIGGNAGGSTAGTSFPVHYYIDYWRVWEGDTDNSAPTDIYLSSADVDEGMPIGTLVGDLSVTDPDPAEVISYTLVAGTGDDDNALFEIPEFLSDRTDTLVLRTAAILDYDDGATRSIRVRATDIERATFTKVLTVNVLPSPAIDISADAISIPEGSTSNVMVKLRVLPSSTVTTQVSRASGDTNLIVQSGATLYFTPANGTNWQQVTLGAMSDPDITNGTAVFVCADLGGVFNSATVMVSEVDSDNPAPIVVAGPDQLATLSSAGSWTPTAIPTAAWFDADDYATISETTGAVSQWSDRSGNSNHVVQLTGSSQPSYNASDSRMNSMPTIGYDLARKFLQSTSSFAVKKVYLTTYYDGATFGSWHIMFASADDTPRAGGWSGNNYFQDNGIDTAYKNGSTTTNYASGVPVLPMGPTIWCFAFDATETNTWTLVSGNASWTGWENGALGEVIMTEGMEDTETEQKIEGYLAHKWGLEAQLPVDHPYRSTTPESIAATISLAGDVTDPNGDPTSTMWHVVSGPGSVSFGDSNAVQTTAEFATPGTYRLRLTATDGTSQTSDDLSVMVGEDADSDGMFDTWEIDHFGSLTNSAAQSTDDQDSDGFPDLHEFLAGTNPTNASSLLALVDGHPGISSNDLILSWQAVSNRTYMIMSTDTLSPPDWITNALGIPGIAPMCVHTVETTGVSSFYLIGLQE